MCTFASNLFAIYFFSSNFYFTNSMQRFTQRYKVLFVVFRLPIKILSTFASLFIGLMFEDTYIRCAFRFYIASSLVNEFYDRGVDLSVKLFFRSFLIGIVSLSSNYWTSVDCVVVANKFCG